MRIAIASDHGGFEAKQLLATHLQEQGHQVLDLGPNSADRCDYPDYAAKLANNIQSGEAERGVLICGTGLGMSMTANRFKGIRAAVVTEVFSAQMCREHNDANVLCMGARISAIAAMQRFLEVFLATPFGGGRHEGRVAKIESHGAPK